MSASNYPNFNHVHFIDPVPNLMQISDSNYATDIADRKVIITGTKRRDESRIGEVIGLHETQGTSLTTSGTNAWFVDANGQHVLGQLNIPLSGMSRQTRIMTMIGDGAWAYGQISRVKGVSREVNDHLYGDRGAVFHPIATSDGSATIGHLRQGGGISRGSLSGVTFFNPASWTEELFPALLDSPELVQLKLKLAEHNWNMRRAQYGLRIESMYRNWDTMLPELEEAGFGLPPATSASIVTATAIVEVETTTDDSRALNRMSADGRSQERLDRVASNGGTVSARIIPMKYVDFTTPVVSRVENATEPTHSEIIQAFTNKFSIHPNGLMNVRQTKFVNTLNRTPSL